MKMIKRTFILTLTIIIIASSFFAVPVFASYRVPFETNSAAAYMVNLDTGTVVYEKNADKQLIPASLTKIITTVLAIEMIPDLEGTVITAPPYVYDELYGLGASTADIWPGEQVRAIDLLYAMMLPSGCEASSIVADYLGDGNISEFVELMNKKAKEIGAVDTVFTNAHGLYHEDQKTTVRDMYLITKYALTLPLFEKVSTTISYEMPATNKHVAPYDITHTNSMLSKQRGGDLYYENVKGIKTGSLPQSGKNLISMATKDGYTYLLVTMGAPAKDDEGNNLPNGAFVDAKKLYEWAFASFDQKTIVKQDEVADEIAVRLSAGQDHVTLLAKNDITALLPKDSDITAIQRIKTTAENVQAPIAKGTVLGRMDLKLNDKIISSVDLIAANDIERSQVLYALDVTGRFFKNTTVQILVGILILLIVLYIFMSARYRKIKRMKAARNRMVNRGK